MNQRTTFGRSSRRAGIPVWVLAAALSFPAAGHPSSMIGPADMAAMMRAMLVMGKMWNSMFGNGSRDLSGSLFGGSLPMDDLGSYPMSAGSWASMLGLADPMSFWGGGAGTSPPGMTQWWGGAPGGNVSPYLPGRQGSGIPLHALEGTWAGANRSLLMVQRNRFMLYLGDRLTGIGTLALSREKLIVRDAISGQSRAYRIALRANGMKWIDRSGRAQVFRRVTR